MLGAIASTGMAEPGDHISGMVNGDGSITRFRNLPVRAIVRLLRGRPGSEVRLLVERDPVDGNGEPTSFDVAVRRSMIVVLPPL